MIIVTLEIAGFRSALEALRLPYGLECRSYTQFACDEKDGEISTKSNIKWDVRDIVLLRTLVQRGPEHAKVLRGINVYAKITAPIYWWCEMETYTVGHYRLASESTMHIDCKGL